MDRRRKQLPRFAGSLRVYASCHSGGEEGGIHGEMTVHLDVAEAVQNLEDNECGVDEQSTYLPTLLRVGSYVNMICVPL